MKISCGIDLDVMWNVYKVRICKQVDWEWGFEVGKIRV